MKDRNVTPGQMRFVWRFMETRVLVLAAGCAGLLLGFVLGVVA